jgi:hypothetical protein
VITWIRRIFIRASNKTRPCAEQSDREKTAPKFPDPTRFHEFLDGLARQLIHDYRKIPCKPGPICDLQSVAAAYDRRAFWFSTLK